MMTTPTTITTQAHLGKPLCAGESSEPSSSPSSAESSDEGSSDAWLGDDTAEVAEGDGTLRTEGAAVLSLPGVAEA
jgi:hypothetical protein